MQFLIVVAFIVLAIALVLLIQFWYLFLAAGLCYLGYRLIRYWLKNRYFASPEFIAQKEAISSVIAEHNEVAGYITEIQDTGAFQIGSSTSGVNSSFASFENTSKFAYNRDRNTVEHSSKFVHNASLQVVRNASIDPIKYLIKYFDIPASEEKLLEVESLSESISRLENAISNLGEREKEISDSFSPPNFITKFYLQEFQSQIGLEMPGLTVPYPVYSFEYLSAGGNSSQKTTIRLDSQTVDRLVETLAEKIKFRKSVAGQRALMTAKLREFIKVRDNYTCKLCKISTRDEAHLLLEIDHVKPVSKGGESVEQNLQALCWKCNRTKASKY